jgi:hypothetical protein
MKPRRIAAREAHSRSCPTVNPNQFEIPGPPHVYPREAGQNGAALIYPSGWIPQKNGNWRAPSAAASEIARDGDTWLAAVVTTFGGRREGAFAGISFR